MRSNSEQSTRGLRIADDFTLPLDAITETFAFLAARGAGKTYSAAVVVEEVIGAGHPAVIIDPLGVWWGLRSSADGSEAGLPVVIFGGEHADLPLEEGSGALIAEAIVKGRFPAILDLSLMSKSAARRFNADFLETLYQLNRDPLLLVVDEADLLAPQRTTLDTARVLGAMEDVVRRGRVRGLGCVLITQRPAVLNKDVLSQASVLVALRMAGKNDVAAIDEWVRLHANEDEAKELKASLPSLPVGTAWLWSPGWLSVIRKIHVRKRLTFDSSATPKVGERRVTPSRLADIDLSALSKELEATRGEGVPANPRELRRRITDQSATITRLRQELSDARAQPARVEVPVFDEISRKNVADLQTQIDVLEGLLRAVQQSLDDLVQRVSTAAPPARKPSGLHAVPPSADSDALPPAAQTSPPPDGGTAIKAGERRILETLARQHPQRLTLTQLGSLSKFKVTGGTFTSYWGHLRRLGFVDTRDAGNVKDYALTEAGFAFLGHPIGLTPLTTDEVLEQWSRSLKRGARRMLGLLVDAYPDALSKPDLAAALDMAASGGTFGAYLGTLRRNGLVEQASDGGVRASETLFPQG